MTDFSFKTLPHMPLKPNPMCLFVFPVGLLDLFPRRRLGPERPQLPLHPALGGSAPVGQVPWEESW